jgi:hypothetical protein
LLIRIVFRLREKTTFGNYLRPGFFEVRKCALKCNLCGRFATAGNVQFAAEEVIGDVEEGN